MVKDTLCAQLLNHQLEDTCACPKEIIYNGSRFRQICVVSIRTIVRNGIPRNGEIKEIMLINETVKLLIASLETIEFNDILQAYLVENENYQFSHFQAFLVELSDIQSAPEFRCSRLTRIRR